MDIEYTRGKDIVVKRGENGVGAVVIGRIPLMLRSDRCRLKGCTEEELARLGARPDLDLLGPLMLRPDHCRLMGCTEY